MKKIIISLMLSMAAFLGANAMSFSRAQEEALYLTDKMAYELNLDEQQYNDAYEINLDYFLSIGSPSDLDGIYYDYRLNDLRCILHDWQYSLLTAADYFLRPLAWRAGAWYFPVYSYYRRNHFYYGRPSVWVSYRGGHSRHYHHAGFYTHRRPAPRVHHSSPGMHRSSPGMHRSSPGIHHSSPSNHRPSYGMGGSRPSSGSHRGGVSPSRSHGNSFDGSSSRMGGGHMSSGSRGGGMSHGSRGGGRGGRR